MSAVQVKQEPEIVQEMSTVQVKQEPDVVQEMSADHMKQEPEVVQEMSTVQVKQEPDVVQEMSTVQVKQEPDVVQEMSADHMKQEPEDVQEMSAVQVKLEIVPEKSGVQIKQEPDLVDLTIYQSHKEEVTESRVTVNSESQLYVEEQEAEDRPSEPSTPVPSIFVRCRYWPMCAHGRACPYIHPSLPCKAFPHCLLGDMCIYIHPYCKNDAQCARMDCQFFHYSRRSTIHPTVFHKMNQVPNQFNIPSRQSAKPAQTTSGGRKQKCKKTNSPFVYSKDNKEWIHCLCGYYCKRKRIRRFEIHKGKEKRSFGVEHVLCDKSDETNSNQGNIANNKNNCVFCTKMERRIAKKMAKEKKKEISRKKIQKNQVLALIIAEKGGIASKPRCHPMKLRPKRLTNL